jgi:hypothetical protein
MPAYNGHKSWNQWNVSLWINNDESLYRVAHDLVSRYGVAKAANRLARDLDGQRTPDGGKYNRTAIYNAISDIL